MRFSFVVFSSATFLLATAAFFPLGAVAFPDYAASDDKNGGLRGTRGGTRPCPYADGLPPDLLAMPDDGPPSSSRGRRLSEGLLNEGRGCMGHCDSTPGDCAYCGTGQCCRLQDYENGVPGCEGAHAIASGSRCGAWAGAPPEGVRNVGKSCSGKCDGAFGEDCAYCGGWDGAANGAGQCCRAIDAERCVPGCELAGTDAWIADGPASQCGAFRDATASHCSGAPPPPPPSPSPPTDPSDPPVPSPADGLLHEGENCSPCDLDQWAGDMDCPSFCGTGQCCNDRDWRRGAPGCELAQNVTGNRVCGAFRDPTVFPEPFDFRLGAPLGSQATPPDEASTGAVAEGNWIMDIVADGSDLADHALPAYEGAGGQPWSKFEMAVVRDLLLFEMRQATAGLDELSAAKFIRLPFHDCLLYDDGTGGCDGCLNWDNVGFRHEGRVEERNFEDHERVPSNNGLGHAVEFLEYLYDLDLGKSWGSGCWKKPGTVVGATARLLDDSVRVGSTEECIDLCKDTPGCRYFTVPHMRSVDASGPCRLFNNDGEMRELTHSTGRLIAGDAFCPHYSWSLRSRGKSRADLWAFASLVAVEEGIQRHNYACDGHRHGMHNGPNMCLQFEGEAQCRINVPRPFEFKTGRADCESGDYKTVKKENRADDHFNGTMTVRFMEDNFQFSAKETVTIMGAHTVGRFHQRQTGHKYVWTTDFQAFNNQYYRNIAGKEDWFFDDAECTRVGDAWGNKGHAVWIAKMNQVHRTGAPVQWIQKKVVCPNCAARSYERGGRNPWRLDQDRDCCLNGVPEGAQCRPDGGPASLPNTKAIDRDDDFSDGCEYSHFIFGRDEAALGSDMGLYHKFNVDTRGFPSGCPGLHTFYPSGFRFSDETCGIDGRPRFEDPTLSWDDPNAVRVTKNEWTDEGCPANCDRNDYQYPGDTLTLSDHVDRYADDQDLWIREFIPVMEKMINNGYEDGTLVTSFSG